MPRIARFYIAVVAAGAAVAVLVSLPALSRSPGDLVALLLFTSAACASQVFQILLPKVPRAYFTIATAVCLAVAIIFGAAAAVWCAVVASVGASVIARRPASRLIFNASQLGISYGAAGLVYHSLWDGRPLANLWPAIPAVLGLAATYFLVNTGLVFLILSLVERLPFVKLWRSSFKRIVVHDVVMVAVALVFVVLWTYNVWTSPLIAPLIFVLYQSMSAVGRMESQTKSALAALAQAIDQRDCNTYAHSERVAEYVEWICNEMRLPADEVEVIVYSARLHDLGKVGVPDGLLTKPGKLTAEEQAQFRRHPDVGADIVAQFPVFREGSNIVRSEHEWFNGEGYPRGLCGDDIPLGARIIAVADAFEAMVSDRPYRRGMPAAVAAERLIAAEHSQFDAGVVRAFLAALAKRQAVEVERTGTVAEFSILGARTEGVGHSSEPARA